MSDYLPEFFLTLMGLAVLAYVVLDGFDLGVGILLRRAAPSERELMIASIGPFWDANETWLVLGVGVLLTVFPLAHGEILGALYLPVALMLIGLTLRGVAFEFRAKVPPPNKAFWDMVFYAGSLLAALAQGFMLGLHIVGYRYSLATLAFAGFIALALSAGYALLGASWLLMKTDGALAARARGWAQGSLVLTACGVLAVSVATPLLSERIFLRWFSTPQWLYLAPVPLFSCALLYGCHWRLRRLSESALAQGAKRLVWQPFCCAVGVFVLAFIGLAYSLFPYLVVDKITIWQAASSTAAMQLIAIGACITLPAIVLYTLFSYRVFWGKARLLSYD